MRFCGRVYSIGKNQEKTHFFITLDLDFADIRRYQPGSHHDILLLRARSRSRPAVLQVLQRVLSEQQFDSLSGCLAVADETHTRIRRPPRSTEA